MSNGKATEQMERIWKDVIVNFIEILDEVLGTKSHVVFGDLPV
jgi:hypothetical protein